MKAIARKQNLALQATVSLSCHQRVLFRVRKKQYLPKQPQMRVESLHGKNPANVYFRNERGKTYLLHTHNSSTIFFTGLQLHTSVLSPHQLCRMVLRIFKISCDSLISHVTPINLSWSTSTNSFIRQHAWNPA